MDAGRRLERRGRGAGPSNRRAGHDCASGARSKEHGVLQKHPDQTAGLTVSYQWSDALTRVADCMSATNQSSSNGASWPLLLFRDAPADVICDQRLEIRL